MSIRKDETRTRILDAARKLLVERGYFGVGLEEVGAAAGVTRQAIYQHHFRSKTELLLALVAHVDEVEGIREVLAPVLAVPNAVLALAAMVPAVATINERIHDVASVLAAARIADPAAEAAWQDRMKLRLSGARIVARRLEKEGRLAPTWSANEAAEFLFSALSLASYQSLVIDLGWSKERYVDRTWTMLHGTLVTPAPAPAPAPAKRRRTRRAP